MKQVYLIITPRYLRYSTAQQYLNCSKDSLERLLSNKYLTIKYIPPNDEKRIDREEIDQLMKGLNKDVTKVLSADDMVNEFLET